MRNNIKKIVVIADNYPSEGRPVLVFVQQLVEQFVNIGVEVVVIAPQSLTNSLVRGNKLNKRRSVEITSDNIKYQVYRPYFFTTGNHLRWARGLVGAIKRKGILEIIKEINPDVIYGHFWHNLLPVYKYAYKKNIPLFVACGEGDNALEELVADIKPQDKSILVGAVKGVISVSSENKRKCITFGLAKSEDIIVLPNCVNTDIFVPGDNEELKTHLGIQNSDFVIAFVGSFIPRKGPKRLTDAISKIQDGNIKSLFIGSPHLGGEEYPEGDSIIFKGSVDHDLIPQYLQVANLFVLPTLKEGCSNAIVEALVTGLPVVSSNGSFNDDILNENNSIRVNPMDVDQIANAIKCMKEDVVFYNKCKKYLLSNRHKYSISDRAKKILQFIDDQINKS